MSTKQVELRLGGRNIFDEYLSLTNKLKHEHGTGYVLEQEVLRLERLLQDVDNSKLSRVAMRRLSYWWSLLEEKESGKKIDINTLTDLVKELVYVIISGSMHSLLHVISDIEQIKVAPPDGWNPPEDHLSSGVLTIDTAFEAAEELDTPFDIDPELIAAPTTSESDLIVWDLKVVFPSDSTNPAQMGFLIWSLSYALQSIEGVRIVLEEWGQGSFWASFRLIFQDQYERDEGYQVLENARLTPEEVSKSLIEDANVVGDGLMAKHFEQHSANLSKTRAEEEKLRVEKEKLAAELESLPSSDEAEKERELELRKLKAEAQLRELQTAREREALLQDRLKTYNQLSELVRQGILAPDEVQITINGLLYVDKTRDQFIPGASMHEISSRRPSRGEGEGEAIEEPVE